MAARYHAAMIDYRGFSDRLASCSDRAARWQLLREVQREWGFVGATNVWAPRTDLDSEDWEDLDDGFEDSDFDEADDDHGYATVVPAALTEWLALPENSFRQAPRLFGTHPMDPPCRWLTARTAAALRKRGLEAEALPPFYGEFVGEYEGCFSWAYRESEAAADDDPPVYILNSSRPIGELAEDFADGGDDPENQRLVARSVTEWALAFVLTRVPFESRYRLESLAENPEAVDPALFDRAAVEQHRVRGFGELTGQQRERLDASYPELGLLPWQDSGGGHLRGGPDVILRQWKEGDFMDSNYELCIAARTPEAMAAALGVLGLTPEG